MQGYITRYFQAYLRSTGWDVEYSKIHWSLSNCQGDGVSFTTKIYPDDLQSVLRTAIYPTDKQPDMKAKDRMLNLIESKRVLDMVEEYDAVFTIATSSSNYSHSGTMRMDLEIQDPPEDGELHNKVEEKLTEIGDLILDAARQACVVLESSGYDILDSSPNSRLGYDQNSRTVRCISTDNFKIEVIEMEDEMYLDGEEEEDKYVLQTAQAIAQGEIRVITVCVRITHTADGNTEEVGCAYIGNVHYASEDKFYSQMLREALSEAVKEARATMCIKKKPSPPDLPELDMAS